MKVPLTNICELTKHLLYGLDSNQSHTVLMGGPTQAIGGIANRKTSGPQRGIQSLRERCVSASTTTS